MALQEECIYMHSSGSNEEAHHEKGEHKSIVGSVVPRHVLLLATELPGELLVLCKHHQQQSRDGS